MTEIYFLVFPSKCDQKNLFFCLSRQQYDAHIEDLESKLDSASQQHEKEKVKAEVEILKLKEELIELRCT